MLQKSGDAFSLGREDIVGTIPYYSIPQSTSPETYILQGRIYDNHRRMTVFNTVMLTDTLYVEAGNDGHVYSFIGNDMIRVQYNRRLDGLAPMDTIYVKPIPESIKFDDKEYRVMCFDGMFDSFFDRTRRYGVDIYDHTLSALQNVKHIVFKDPPKRILSMNEMFRNLPLLETIDISNWEIPPWCLDDETFYPFVNCPRLREIIIKDYHVTEEHLRRWLTYNFNTPIDCMPITAHTVNIYNTHKYMFTSDISTITSRNGYEECYDKHCLKDRKGDSYMSEVACDIAAETGIIDEPIMRRDDLLSSREWSRNGSRRFRNNREITDFPERNP